MDTTSKSEVLFVILFIHSLIIFRSDLQMRMEFSVLWSIERWPLVHSYNIILILFFGVAKCDFSFM